MKIPLLQKIIKISMLTLLPLCSSGLQAASMDDWGDWGLDNERFIVQPEEDGMVIERQVVPEPLDAEEQAIFQSLDNSQLTDYPDDGPLDMEDDRESFLQQLEELERAHIEDEYEYLPESSSGSIGIPTTGRPIITEEGVIILEAGELSEDTVINGENVIIIDGDTIESLDDLPLDVLDELPEEVLNQLDTELELESELQELFDDGDIIIEDDSGYQDELEGDIDDWQDLTDEQLEQLEAIDGMPLDDMPFDAEFEVDIADEMDL